MSECSTFLLIRNAMVAPLEESSVFVIFEISFISNRNGLCILVKFFPVGTHVILSDSVSPVGTHVILSYPVSPVGTTHVILSDPVSSVGTHVILSDPVSSVGTHVILNDPVSQWVPMWSCKIDWHGRFSTDFMLTEFLAIVDVFAKISIIHFILLFHTFVLNSPVGLVILSQLWTQRPGFKSGSVKLI